MFVYVLFDIVCTYRTGAIRREVQGAPRGVYGPVPRQEVYTRAVPREVSGPDRIRSCATPVGRLAWTVRARTTPDHVGSKLFFFS